jgi:hypothetical protein
MIRDNDLRAILSTFDASTKVLAVSDSCHSGSIFDLDFTFHPSIRLRSLPPQNHRPTSPKPLPCHVVCISGCLDSDTSADVFDPITDLFTGAMTMSLLHCLRHIPAARSDVTHLVKCMRTYLSRKGYPQTPQLTSSRPIQTEPFFPLRVVRTLVYAQDVSNQQGRLGTTPPGAEGDEQSDSRSSPS